VKIHNSIEIAKDFWAFSQNVWKSFPFVLKSLCISVFSCVVIFLVLHTIFPPRVLIDYSRIVYSKEGQILHVTLSSDQKWRIQAHLSEIPERTKQILLYKEDKYFYYHFGINPISVCTSLLSNIISGKRLSGASTITMQVARLLQPKSRTYSNKIIEMFRALQLEFLFSKDEILEMYCNLLPYGGNYEGIKTASFFYFQKPVANLSLAQVVAMTIIPNKPTSLRLQEGNNSIVAQRTKWLESLKYDDIITLNEFQEAKYEPFEPRKSKLPNFAPHFSTRLSIRYPRTTEIHSTLDARIQQLASTLTKNYSNRLHSQSIFNASVIIIDNKTSSVIAYVGSNNFYDTLHAGQVDGITATRSPGSTLKPLLYAKAFEAGLVTPKKMMLDIPINYSGYVPENLDLSYRGMVTMEDALINSLNIPAVNLLAEYGLERFLNDLDKAQMKTVLKQRKKLGLSVILGGCGTSLEELTTLFSIFAKKGTYSPLNFLRTESQQIDTTRVLQEESAYILSTMLASLTRPDLPTSVESNIAIPRISWKTGTSYGKRDAWSIGYNKQYTIGVWVGNFNGTGVPTISGAQSATPLLFELFSSLQYRGDVSPYELPSNLQQRMVCSESGDIPNSFCTSIVNDVFIPLRSSNKVCTHLKTVTVSADETVSYCTSCQPVNGTTKRLYSNYPASLLAFYSSQGVKKNTEPPHNPECNRFYKQGAPVITSIVNDKDYIIENDSTQKIQLSAVVQADVSMVYWYVNDKLISSSPASTPYFYKPKEGIQKISCSDDKGRNSTVTITVKYAR
jgi:penicillin-binding protein 1C